MDIALEITKLGGAALAGAYAMYGCWRLLIGVAVSDGILHWRGRTYRIVQITGAPRG